MLEVRLLYISVLLAITTIAAAQGAVDAESWLKTTIKEHFGQEPQQHFSNITTKQYAAYKQDAINVAYDLPGSLTREQFKQKWSTIYDIAFAGIGESFLLGTQDHGLVTLSKCALNSHSNQEAFIFDTLISDNLSAHSYSIEITIVKTKDGFRIDDVKKRR